MAVSRPQLTRMGLVPADLDGVEETRYGPWVVSIAAILFINKTTATPIRAIYCRWSDAGASW